MNDKFYCSEIIPLNCLEYIRRLLFCANREESWAQVYIDLFFSNNGFINMHCSQRRFGSERFTLFELDETAEVNLNLVLTKFSASVEKAEDSRPWNKARIDYTIGAPKLEITYKIDEDLAWLMINTEPFTFLERNPTSTELEIMLWPGLPENHERPWLESNEGLTAAEVAASGNNRSKSNVLSFCE